MLLEKGSLMNPNHWMTGAGPAALAGVGSRATVVEVSVHPGSGAECDYCRRPLNAEAIEYEVKVLRFAALRTLHFHRHCHRLWEIP